MQRDASDVSGLNPPSPPLTGSANVAAEDRSRQVCAEPPGTDHSFVADDGVTAYSVNLAG
jgi:hypothetical protein